ncbi:hypothetical protein TrLO_g7883 [Triparma laevis f. longispina]|uniref:Sugar phosphate transporter domain-containing protein n=1 Tax=Triparma laevis f. longispina TaxID=1714387 RepID=A0A9W7DZ91_9STRA|nr:hypothetical protein TrLO_g7883 [Triparma laevis f. longispina]
MNSLPAAVLMVWLTNNIGVTLLNKAAFATVDFKYPFMLTSVHMSCNSMGTQCYQAWKRREQLKLPSTASEEQEALVAGWTGKKKQFTPEQKKAILAYSVIFSLNIAIGNLSLRHVSVNFNQVMRSLVPAITLGVGILQGKAFSMYRRYSVGVVVLGVLFACYGDMTYSAVGFMVTVFCVLLAAAKVTVSGEMLTGKLKMHPIDLLGRMAPLALLQCSLISLLSGEVSSIASRWTTDLSPFVNPQPFIIVLMSGFASFTLNISSLYANKLTSPLTLCIAANVKQVIMIATSTILFETPINFLNGLGILIVLTGSFWYSYMSLMEKHQDKK